MEYETLYIKLTGMINPCINANIYLLLYNSMGAKAVGSDGKHVRQGIYIL